MKRVLLCLAMLMLTILPSSEDEIAVNNLWTVTDGITLRLAQDSYPPNPSTMTLILENRSDSVMLYGQGWSFEKSEGGSWRKLETKANYGFTMVGYSLYDHDKKTFAIWIDFLNEPLDEGLYRVTGCSLRVAPDDQNLSYGMDYVEYPPYQLEFTVSESATPEADDMPETQLAKWQLPDIEAWQWYTPWDALSMYEDAGMQFWRFVQGENGLVAILYRNTRENEYLNAGDLLLLDIFDRKTGKRYEVFTEPTVESQKVLAYKDGFRVNCGSLLYCFINDDDMVVTVSLIDE